MGNTQHSRISLSSSLRGNERFIEPYEFLTPREEMDLLRSLTFFDRRYDYRFGKATLYKNSTETIVAKIKHRFTDFAVFNRYCQKYEEREKISNIYLLKILFLYNTHFEDPKEEVFTINLILEYPYNDLKNEINFRLIDNKRFTTNEIFKMLKCGVSALLSLKKNRYSYPFELTQYSVCIFEKPNGKKAFKLLEFTNLENDPLEEPEELESLYSWNCKSLAMIIVEAGLLINKNLLAENCDEALNLRYLDQFTMEFAENKSMCSIVESFAHMNDTFTLESANKELFKNREDKNQRYLFQDNQIVVKTENKRTTRFDAEKMKAKIS